MDLYSGNFVFTKYFSKTDTVEKPNLIQWQIQDFREEGRQPSGDGNILFFRNFPKLQEIERI